jgi:hypothetical protein
VLRIDVHQHLWTPPLVEALARRSEPPFIRHRGRIWELVLTGEAPCTIDVDGDDVVNRGALVHLDGLDLAVLSLSTVLGVEGLPGEEARQVLDAYESSVEDLPSSFQAWGALPLRDAVPADVDAVLDRGHVGIAVPAGAIATPRGIDRLGPLLQRAQDRCAPVFVHPGPDPFAAIELADGPAWLPALTQYVAWMNNAWHTFIAVGRKQLPGLQIVFSMLAGGAPLHLERLAARGGPAAGVFDRGIYYDTSSYGSRAIDAVVRVVGIDQLVHGSDRPVVAPPAAPGPLGDAAWAAMTRWNPARLLAPQRQAVAA